MHPSAPSGNPPSSSPSHLEESLGHVESRLGALGTALRARDPGAIDLHAGELQRALAHAVHQFSNAARSGPVPSALRTRLATASGEVAAQRESLARATAALDRAIDVLLPREPGTLYSSWGSTDRGGLRGDTIQA